MNVPKVCAFVCTLVATFFQVLGVFSPAWYVIRNFQYGVALACGSFGFCTTLSFGFFSGSSIVAMWQASQFFLIVAMLGLIVASILSGVGFCSRTVDQKKMGMIAGFICGGAAVFIFLGVVIFGAGIVSPSGLAPGWGMIMSILALLITVAACVLHLLVTFVFKDANVSSVA